MKQNLRQKTLALCAMLGLFGLTISAQEVFQVEAGSNGIGVALLDAVDGDIIELTTSGGVYIEDMDSIYYDVTIRAAAGLAEKPIIQDSDLGHLIEVREGALTLDGIKFDGGEYIVYVKAPAGVEGPDFSLKINNCDFQDWTQRAVYSTDATETPLDSVIITNCTFKNGVKQAIYLKTTRTGSGIYPAGYKYCGIFNCLFVGLSSDGDGHATYIEPGNRDVLGDGYPELVIDHVTVDNCTRGLSTYTTPGALVKNVILSNPTDVTRTSINIESARYEGAVPSMIKNSVYVGALNLTGSSTVTGITENVDSAAVVYVDRENGNYALAAGSPGKGAATDGKDVGYIPPSTTSVHSMKLESFVNVYPNPTSGHIKITLDKKVETVKSLEIINIAGKKVAHQMDLGNNQELSIDISSAPAGIYFGKVVSINGTYTFKFMKK